MKNDFLTIFEGKYSVDIHSRTNAIGMLVNNPNRFGFRSKVLALFDDNLLKNNITENDVTYKVEDWNIYFTGQNGKMISKKYVLNVFLFGVHIILVAIIVCF